jgi:hypothetical protein
MKKTKLFFNILKNVIKDTTDIRKELGLNIFIFVAFAPYIYVSYSLNVLNTIYK